VSNIAPSQFRCYPTRGRVAVGHVEHRLLGRAASCVQLAAMTLREHEMDPDGMDDEMYSLSSSAPSSGGLNDPSKNSRLARKAESAKQARLRHKQYVTELQGECRTLQNRVHELERASSGPASAIGAVNELKAALSPEQLTQLRQWLTEAQGTTHVLARIEAGASLAASTAAAAAPAQRAAGDFRLTPTSGAASSPVENMDEMGVFTLTRSHDDEDVARSILYLNSPNGFHPMTGGDRSLPPLAPLPSAALPPSTLPSILEGSVAAHRERSAFLPVAPFSAPGPLPSSAPGLLPSAELPSATLPPTALPPAPGTNGISMMHAATHDVDMQIS
jgi:hypothetical protein